MSSIIGYYSTQFGELWKKSLFDLVKESVEGVLKENYIEMKQIDAIFFGNMLSGVLENNLHSSAKLSEIFHTNVSIFRVEAACASGGMAFHLAKQYLDAYSNKTVLVIGAEKMTDYSPEETTDALAAAAPEEEQNAGLTFPGLYALMAQAYCERYHYTEEHLAHIAFKNHYHGSLNEKAHFKNKITIEQILKSAYVAHPLKVLDCSPISDGAAALLVTNDSKKTKHKVEILSSEVATDVISLKNRKDLLGLKSVRIATQKAYLQARIKPDQVDVAELHDCFTIAEILAMEDLGFWKKGSGGKMAKELVTMHGKSKKLVVNTSGGLKAAGHPVGATGVKQIGEIFLQLTNQASTRQVKSAEIGLTHNVGGSGGTAVITILRG